MLTKAKQMRVENLIDIADCKTEVCFLLTPEAANSKTLFLEVGWIYAAVFSNDESFGDQGIHYYSYPYAYTGKDSGGKPTWQIVGRPWCDFDRLVMFTTLEEAIAFEREQEMICRRYGGDGRAMLRK